MVQHKTNQLNLTDKRDEVQALSTLDQVMTDSKFMIQPYVKKIMQSDILPKTDQASLNVPPATYSKYSELKRIFIEMKEVLIAFSAGVDSTFLLKVAVDTLGKNVQALTAISGSYPEWELKEARRIAQEMNVELIEVHTQEMQREGYRLNAGDRCYHCKAELFDVAQLLQSNLDLQAPICYGAITDDLGDHRPGMQAAQERAARAPLIEANLSKADIRILSKALGLSTWDKPSSACLSSRFPYGIEITPENLAQVGRCEARLMTLGLRTFRARYHGDLVRIELGSQELDRVWKEASLRQEMIQVGKSVGFTYVSIDLEGFRSGSGNETLVQLI
jgi:pyridinium-3,5-biscarboxylic acid mononucleotide sulfurtransferase